MGLPTIVVETAGGNALSVPGSWTDITTDAIGTISIQRGRSKLLDESQAGSGALELNNSTRKYDPSNTSSPFNPLSLWRKFRIQATFNAVTYPLMYGFALAYRLNWQASDGPNFTRTTVALTDGAALLALQEFNNIRLSTEEYGARIDWILSNAEVGWPAAWRSGTSATGYDCKPHQYSRAKAWDAIKQAVGTAQADPGNVIIDGAGKVAVNPGGASGYTFGPNLAGGELPYSAASLELSDDLVINEARVTRIGGVEAHAHDNASVAAYGLKTYSRETVGNSDTDSSALVHDILTRYAQPKLRPEGMTVRPGRSDAVWTAVLDLDVGDTFTLKATPPGGGSAFSKTMKILGLRHTIPYDLANWTTQYEVVEQ